MDGFADDEFSVTGFSVVSFFVEGAGDFAFGTMGDVDGVEGLGDLFAEGFDFAPRGF